MLAFFNSILEEEVYVQQPKGFLIKGQEDKVYHLKKALYGLKQATQMVTFIMASPNVLISMLST